MYSAGTCADTYVLSVAVRTYTYIHNAQRAHLTTVSLAFSLAHEARDMHTSFRVSCKQQTRLRDLLAQGRETVVKVQATACRTYMYVRRCPFMLHLTSYILHLTSYMSHVMCSVIRRIVRRAALVHMLVSPHI